MVIRTGAVALALVLSSCALTGAGPSRVGTAGAGAPNVLVFLTDDQRGPGTMQVMPSVRRIFGDGGTRFVNGLTNTPLCCPARATLLSGRYAHNHGVRRNFDTDELDQDTTLEAYLKEAGYATGIAGKFLNFWDPQTDPPHFDRWALFHGNRYVDEVFNIDGETGEVPGYINDVVERNVLDFMNDFEEADNEPWLIFVTPFAPHYPSVAEPRYKSTRVGQFPQTPAMRERDNDDKPPFIEKRRHDPERLWKKQLRSLISVDDTVERVFEELRELGESNTLAFFLSDNGYLWGEYNFTGKRPPYTPSIQVPFYVRWPGRVDAGKVDRSLVLLSDVAPTILDAADLDVPVTMDGRSILTGARRTRALLEHYGGSDTPVPDWASTRTARFQYVEYYGSAGEVIFREYYDLRRDPWQLHNLLGDSNPANDPNVAPLSLQLAEDRVCTGPTCP